MTRKRLLIDLSPLRLGYCGLWEYAYRFGNTLLSLYDPSEFDITFLAPSNHPFPKDASVKIKSLSVADRYLKFIVPDYDLYHTVSHPSPFMPGKRFKGKRMVTVHDLNFLYEKSSIKIQHYLRRYQRALSRVDQLVFISEYAKRDAEKHLKYDIPSTVIYNGVAFANDIEPQKPIRTEFAESPYLFTVSTFMRKKNIHTIVQMMAHLPGYNLVIAGKVIHESYFEEVKHLVRKLGLDRQVFFIGEITDVEKAWLYTDCEAFLFPSIAEGFGIPPIEAMNRGKPVFVSNRTSLPEVCGELAFYWENFDPEYMAGIFKSGMIRFRNDPAYSEQLKKYAACYSWQTNVSKYLELYREVLS